MNNNLKFIPTPLQKRYLSCPADDIHFGGNKGSGKTVTLAIEAFIDAMKYPGLRIALFRRSLVELESTIIKECMYFYPKHLYKYISQKRKMVFVNGSTIYFNYLESEKDLLQHQGVEYDFIGFDEAGNHNESHLNVLYACLRTKRSDYRTKWRVNSNPIGIGKGYLVRRFVKGKTPFAIYYTPETMSLPVEKRRTMCFIPAKMGDNPHLLEKNPAYYEQLKLLPPEMQKALIYGDYESRSGAVFSTFNEKIHVEWEDYIPKPDDQLFISYDHGTIKPFSVGWYAIDSMGTIHLYRSYYGCVGQNPDQGLNLIIEDIAYNIISMCGNEQYKFMVVDYAIDEHKGYEATIYEKLYKIMQSRNITVIKCSKNRQQGISNIQSALIINPMTRQPRFMISPSCKYAIMQLNDVIYNDQGTDLEKGQIEHEVDQMIYFFNTRPSFTIIPNSQKFPEGSVGYRINKLLEEEKKK